MPDHMPEAIPDDMPESAGPRPDEVRAGYSQERPRQMWLSRVVGPLLLVALVLSCVQWARLTTPQADALEGPPEWREPIPQAVLAPAAQELADSVSSYEGAVPVLNFHAVSSKKTHGMQSRYATPTKRFAEQMATLDRAGFHTITLAQMRDFLAGRATLPSKPILLTFDDGHATTLHVVDPILAQHGFTAVSFPITGSVPMSETPSYYMNREEIERLEDTGRWEFGSHTHAQHRYAIGEGGVEVSALDHWVQQDGATESAEQWHQRVDTDLASSRTWLDQELPGTTAFAYPFGAHGVDSADEGVPGELSEMLRRHGFTMAFIGQDTSPYRAVLPGDDPLALPRLGMLGSTTPAQMLTLLEDSLPATMPADVSRERWSGSAVACRPHSSGQHGVEMVLGQDGYAECRMGLNTASWDDYTVSTRVVGASDEEPVSLVVRDGQDWAQEGSVEVQITGRTYRVRERTRTDPVVLAERRLPAADSDGHSVRLSVRGRSVSVVVDGAAPVRSRLRSVSHGGVTLGLAGTKGDRAVFADPVIEGDTSRKG